MNHQEGADPSAPAPAFPVTGDNLIAWSTVRVALTLVWSGTLIMGLAGALSFLGEYAEQAAPGGYFTFKAATACAYLLLLLLVIFGAVIIIIGKCISLATPQNMPGRRAVVSSIVAMGITAALLFAWVTVQVANDLAQRWEARFPEFRDGRPVPAKPPPWSKVEIKMLLGASYLASSISGLFYGLFLCRLARIFNRPRLATEFLAYLLVYVVLGLAGFLLTILTDASDWLRTPKIMADDMVYLLACAAILGALFLWYVSLVYRMREAVTAALQVRVASN